MANIFMGVIFKKKVGRGRNNWVINYFATNCERRKREATLGGGGGGEEGLGGRGSGGHACLCVWGGAKMTRMIISHDLL